MLRQIIYTSKVNPKNEKACLSEISQASAHNNSLRNITGILFFDGKHFFQILEGFSQDVEKTFDRIKNDIRHYEVTIIFDAAIRSRDFPDWNSSMVMTEVSEWEYVKTFCNSAELKSRKVTSIINSFISGRWNSEKRFTKLSRPVTNHSKVVNLNERSYGNFSFAYQPIVDSVQGNVSSYEALLRDRDKVFPAKYIESLPAQQKYHFDLHSKEVAISKVAPYLESHQAVSINLLPGAFIDIDSAADFILNQMSINSLEPEQLIIEVTESEIIRDFQRFKAKADALRTKGILIAMDDFGAGYAGLSTLANFPPDKIKLDRNLVFNIQNDGVKQALVSAVVEFSTKLGIIVVAEGVEDKEELRCLANLGIQRFQGYLFAKPCYDCLPFVTWESFFESAV